LFLTEKQIAVLNFIRDFIADRAISPTLEEMAQYFGVSKITIHEHVKALETKGAIRKQPNRKRSIELIDDASQPGHADTAPSARPLAPVLTIRGRVAAGEFIEEVEANEEFSMENLASDVRSCYMLRVEGDSMIDAHICDGDLVIIQPAQTAENGQIVVARIDDLSTGGKKATVKRFYNEPEQDRVRLQPANEQLEPMLLASPDVEIEGHVVGVVRPRL
jgi:repressor LexA